MAVARSTIRTDVTADTTQFVREMRRAEQTANAFNRSMQGAARGVAAIDGPLGGISGRINALNTLVSSGALAWTGLGTAIAAVVAVMYKSITASAEAERQFLRMEAIIRTTGESAGRTAEQLDEQARALALSTLASTEGVRDAQSALLTFGSVQREVFDRAIVLSQDIAEVFRVDIAQAAKQIGKALEEPAKGLSSLARSGITFTESQKELIKTLDESGRRWEAQQIILDRIEEQVGGAGEAAAGGLIGAIDTLGQRWQEFLQALERTMDSGSIATTAINTLSNAIKNFQDLIAPGEQDVYTQIFRERERLTKAIEIGRKFEKETRDEAFREEIRAERINNEKRLEVVNAVLRAKQAAREASDRREHAIAKKSIEIQKKREAERRAAFLEGIAEEAYAAAKKADEETDRNRKRAEKAREAAARRVEEIRVFMGDEEDAIRLSYRKRAEILAEALKLEAIFPEQYHEMSMALLEKRDNEIKEWKKKHNKELLDEEHRVMLERIQNAKTIADSLASIARDSVGEQSAIYKVMFAASKGFAIASSVVNIAKAMGDVMATGVTIYDKLAAAAIIAAEGAAIISTIKEAQLAGQADAGMTSVPRGGTYMLSQGERVLSPAQNKDLGRFMNEGGVTVNINNYSGAEVTQTREDNQINIMIGAVKQSMTNDIRRGTGIADDLQQTYGLTRAGVV